MATFCPQCKERFDEGSGVCPRDGTPLEVVSDRPPDDEGEVSSLGDTAEGAMALEHLESPGQPDTYERLVGTILDERYHIERMLGQGGTGAVFLARHAVIEKMVAVKVLELEAARDVVERFMQEARAASRIGHPNIVGVTDFGTTPEGITYSVMEYVEGDTLDHVIATHAPMAPSRALSIAAQIARALGAAHDKGVVHRDLEPHSIFVLDKDGRDFVKLVDVGIATVAAIDSDAASTRLTRAGAGAILGTPEYMAPERAAGRSDIDHRADIYSLGIILYEMIVGRVPHKGEHAMGTLAMQMLDPIEPPRKALPGLAISDELEQVMLRALAKDPDERFPSVHELSRALERASESAHRQQARVAPERQDRERQARQRRRLLLAAALVLLAGGGAATALLTRGDGANQAARPRVGAADASKATPGPANPGDAAPRVPDAAVQAMIGDAGASADAPVAAAALSEKAHRHRPGTANKIGARRQIEIQVVTIPNYANLYIDHDYSGTSGTTIRKPEGTVAEVECRLEGYLPGRVKVRFDGTQEMYECKLTFIERCIEGIKNPFDDCP